MICLHAYGVGRIREDLYDCHCLRQWRAIIVERMKVMGSQ